MRLKADALGVHAEDYEHAHVVIDEQYSGVATREISGELISEIYAKGRSPWDAGAGQGLYPNQFVVLTSLENAEPDGDGPLRPARRAHQARRSLQGRHLGNLRAQQGAALRARAPARRPHPARHARRMAGTGKTLLAMACGLQKVADDRTYRRLVVSRPIFPLGRDIGFLPGDISEKLNPWMKPIFDNLELLLGSQDEDRKRAQPNYQALLDQGVIEVEPLTYIRGARCRASTS
jgi:PhoH-like ATPase